jgi:putative RecB family exonuclease
MRDHISYTQISTYMNCSLKYFYQYIEQIEWPFKPEGLIFGSAIHKALEHFYLGRQEGRDVPVPEMMAIFDACWEKEESSNTIRFKNGNTADKLHSTAEGMLSTFKKTVQPGEVLSVEQSFKVELVDPDTKESLGVPLVGRIDLIEKLDDGTIAVVDQKTAARAYDNDRVENDLQLTAYAYVMAKEGHDLDNVSLRFDVLMKNGSYKLLSYKTTRTMDDLARLFKIARSVTRGVEAGAFYPSKSWMCNGCPYAEQCAKW